MRLVLLSLAVVIGFAFRQERVITVMEYEAPKYPAIARNARIQGEVLLTLGITKEGKVVDATLVRGHPLLRKPALEAVKKWRFACSGCETGKSVQHDFLFVFRLSTYEHADREVLLRQRAELGCGNRTEGDKKEECERIRRKLKRSCKSNDSEAEVMNSGKMIVEAVGPCVQVIT